MKAVLHISFSVLFLAAASLQAAGQQANALIRSGNRYYKQKQIDQAQKKYEEAIQQAPGDPMANFNLGDAQFRKNSFDEAAKSYGTSIEHTPDKAFEENSLYNKGLALVKGQKLQEGIDAWENALKIDPSDQEARENLQKAKLELKRQQQQQQQQQKQQQQKKDQKQQPKNQDQQNQQQQQKSPPSRLTKQQAEQLLKALQERENEVQQKMNQNKTQSSSQPDKDW